MARYLLKRIWSASSDDAMLENALRSKRVREADFLDITWDHSHVVADETGRAISFCIYDAPSVERILEHASVTGEHFVDHVLPLIADVDGPGASPWEADDPSPRYLVVQRWANGATHDQIGAAVHDADDRSPDVTLEHSHLGTDDQGQVLSHSVYHASDDALVRRHTAHLAGSEHIELFEIGGDVRPQDLVG